MESVAAGARRHPFADVTDFATRVDPRQINRMQIENLVRAGAFDRLDKNRARLFAGAETILRRAQADQEEKESGQIGLFGGIAQQARTPAPPDIPDWPPLERLAFEAEAVGFHLTAHPLDTYAQALRRLGVTQSSMSRHAPPPASAVSRSPAPLLPRRNALHAPAAAWPGSASPTPPGRWR